MHLLSVVVVLSAGLNSIVAFAPRGCISNSVFPIARYVISTPLSSAEEDNLEGLNEEDDDPDPPPKGIFQQINDALDTPILDANDRSNQGPVAEALKRFVRLEPQLASVTFSAVVVTVMFVLYRLYNFVIYGI